MVEEDAGVDGTINGAIQYDKTQSPSPQVNIQESRSNIQETLFYPWRILLCLETAERETTEQERREER